MTKKSTKDFFKRYALSQEFKTKTVPNNSFREDGVQDRFVDLLEVNKNELIRICVEEAGKTIKDAIDDLREAIDFCYYYSNQSKKIFLEDEILIGPTGEKNILK